MILETIKKQLGLDENYDAFDSDIVFLINDALSVLKQLGVTVNGTLEVGSDKDWDEIFDEHADIDMIKNYVFLKVKVIFDPPLNGSVLSTYKETIKEYEYRINLEVETRDSIEN